jgi:hypothetical protein
MRFVPKLCLLLNYNTELMLYNNQSKSLSGYVVQQQVTSRGSLTSILLMILNYFESDFNQFDSRKICLFQTFTLAFFSSKLNITKMYELYVVLTIYGVLSFRIFFLKCIYKHNYIVLYGCVIRFLSLSEDRTLPLFENKPTGRIFESKSIKTMETWGQLHI